MIVQIFTIIDATCSCEPYIVKYKVWTDIAKILDWLDEQDPSCHGW